MNTLKCFDFEDDFICAAESIEQALEIQAKVNGDDYNKNGEYSPEELSNEQMKAMPCYLDEARAQKGTVLDVFFAAKQAGIILYHDV